MSRPSQEDYYPKKLGVQYDPPAIILEYYNSEQAKSRFHRMKIPSLRDPTEAIVQGLRSRHSFYFYNDKITADNLRKLVEKLKRNNGGEPDSPKGPLPIKKEFSFKDPIEAAQKQPVPSSFQPTPQPLSKPVTTSKDSESEINYEEDFEQFEDSKGSSGRLSKSSKGNRKEEESYSSSKPEEMSESKNSLGGFEFLDDAPPKKSTQKPSSQPFKKPTSTKAPPPLYDPTPIPKAKAPADFDFEFL